MAHVASLMLHVEHAATAEEPHNQSRKIGHEKFCILQIVVSSSRLEKYVCHVLTVHIFFLTVDPFSGRGCLFSDRFSFFFLTVGDLPNIMPAQGWM